MAEVVDDDRCTPLGLHTHHRLYGATLLVARLTDFRDDPQRGAQAAAKGRLVWLHAQRAEGGARLHQAGVRDLPFLIQSNFDVPPSLRSKIEECVQFCNGAQPSDAWDASKMCRLLDLWEDCLAAFDACVAEAQEGCKQAQVKSNPATNMRTARITAHQGDPQGVSRVKG